MINILQIRITENNIVIDVISPTEPIVIQCDIDEWKLAYKKANNLSASCEIDLNYKVV